MIEGLFGLFQKLIALFQEKKKPSEEPGKKDEEKEKKPPELRPICADDLEVYEKILYGVLPRQPPSIKPSATIKTAMEEAAERGHFLSALQLALWKDDPDKVREYWSKYAELYGKEPKILAPGMAERAVKKTREYYAAWQEWQARQKKKSETF